MKSTAVTLCSALLLAGASCERRPDPPPVPVVVDRAVPVPCRIEAPVCPSPAYDSAKKGQPMDVRVALLRVEAAQREACLAKFREALEACRAAPAGPPAAP